MRVLNAMDLKAGAKAERSRLGTITQPLQFLPREEKDDEWLAWNADWLEFNGLKQIRRNARRLLKNYKLANGIIDRSDYIVEEDNDYKDMVDILAKDEPSALELKFYPIVPNIINVLTSEFAKRNAKVTFYAVDDFSYNEMLESKREMVEKTLLADAQMKLLSKMIEMGLDPDSPEAQQQMSPENLKTLPEIQEFFKKDYRGIAEQWAAHQHRDDIERFKMDELEERGFRDSLVTDREFWHFRMMEDDYDIELWNPVTTFYHKSPYVRYTSQGTYAGNIELMTVADTLNRLGPIMTQEQRESLEAVMPAHAAGYTMQGYQNDGSYYDATRSHKWNTNPPSLAYRQFTSMRDGLSSDGGDIISWIMGESEDYTGFSNADLLRVSTMYWKTQRKVGWLTKIDDQGQVHEEIVIDESYRVTDKPIYDTTFMKNKTTENLLFGEHIEWIWVNETWGLTKVGPNRPTYLGMESNDNLSPMYLGITSNKPGPLRFQFKGDHSVYGCKIPVEGAVFSDRNSRSTSLVDRTKPFQVGYNMVNNQIADILIDELGTVVMLDQNALPKHSLGEDWGKNSYANAYVAMKDFQILPLDTSITNTENPLHFQHFQTLNLEQTQRFLSRINLANYFKQQAFEAIGITPQRLGQQIGQTNTAQGVEQAVAGSYAQTEMYFIQHSDYLMPRVHQMRTDLAQFYQATKPSLRLQYTTSADERIYFEMNGKDLLTTDINVYCTTKANHRAVIEKMKDLALGNNTSGATIYDLGNIMQADSLSQLSQTLKTIEEKATTRNQEAMQSAERVKQMEVEGRIREKQIELDVEERESEKDRRKDILVAEIRAAGYGAMQDINQNAISDFQDVLSDIRTTEQYKDQMTLETTKLSDKRLDNSEKIKIQRDKIALEKEKATIALQIARENKNKYDTPNPKSRKGKK